MQHTGSFVQKASDIILRERGEKRPRILQLNSNIFTNDEHGPAPQTLVEISGAPSSGKTILLQELMAQCLPPTCFGGKNCDIIFLNISHKFDVKRFGRRIHKVLMTSGERADPSEFADVVQNCLDAVNMIDCFTPEDCEMALEMVDHLLWDNLNVALIAIDTFCDFYWLDLDARQKRTTMHNYYMQWVGRLGKLCKKHYVCGIYTVDNKFTEEKYITATSSAQVLVHHKIKLDYLPDGRRCLNHRPISIDADGVFFGDKNTC